MQIYKIKTTLQNKFIHRSVFSPPAAVIHKSIYNGELFELFEATQVNNKRITRIEPHINSSNSLTIRG